MRDREIQIGLRNKCRQTDEQSTHHALSTPGGSVGTETECPRQPFITHHRTQHKERLASERQAVPCQVHG
jgi:hypothetical protein